MILKYQNRKLYCTLLKRYITVFEAYPKILEGRIVVEHKTQKDITNEILSSYITHEVLPYMPKTFLLELAAKERL